MLSASTTKLGRHAARRGVFPTYWPQAMLRRLEPSYVIDVGANRGQFSLDVHTALPHTPIIAFEPLQHEAAVYTEVFGGVPSVELRVHAVGAAEGVKALHVTRSADSSSLLAPTELQNATFPDTDEIDQIDVTISTLDDALAEIDLGARALLKADVQGYELEVLKGAPLTCERCVGCISSCRSSSCTRASRSLLKSSRTSTIVASSSTTLCT